MYSTLEQQIYLSIHILASLVQIIGESKLPPVCWEHQKGDLQLTFDGVPYIWLGNCDFQCHQGFDKNIGKKKKHHLNQQKKLKSDHAVNVETRKLTQPTKKVIVP